MPRLRPEPKSVEQLALERSRDPQPGPTLEEVKREHGGLFESKPDAPNLLLQTEVAEHDPSKQEFLPAEPVKPAVEVEETPDEATLALQKQIEALKKSEELQRNYAQRMMQEREEALRRAEAHAAEVEQYKRTNQEQEEVAIGSALAAAKAEADKALSDYKNALDAGDTSAQAEAMDKLTDAKANLRLLERGKEEIEQRKKEPPKVEPPRRAVTDDPIDGYGLPTEETKWLKAHRDYVTDPAKRDDLAYANSRARRMGLEPGHPDYLPKINSVLREIGSLPNPEEPKDEPDKDRGAIVSAPVSREAQSGSTGQRQSTGKIRLSAEEIESARLSGITEVEYARQKQRLMQLKANGEYSQNR